MPKVLVVNSKNEADYLVCMTKNKWNANLAMFAVENEYDANEDWLWKFIDDEYDVDDKTIKIHWIFNPDEADFKVYETDNYYDAQ